MCYSLDLHTLVTQPPSHEDGITWNDPGKRTVDCTTQQYKPLVNGQQNPNENSCNQEGNIQVPTGGHEGKGVPF